VDCGAEYAEIVALHVIDMSTYSGLPTKEARKSVKEMLIKQGKKAFDEVVVLSIKCKQKYDKEIKMTFLTKEGNPADEILKTIEAEGVDLVIIGTSGKHGLNRFLLGSVSDKVVRSGPCPVLVVR
jgi:nucleotide-binding universal stress UspA family protein